jgi:hypothetical protein
VEIINVEKWHEFLTQGSQGFLVLPAQLIRSAVSKSDINIRLTKDLPLTKLSQLVDRCCGGEVV